MQGQRSRAHKFLSHIVLLGRTSWNDMTTSTSETALETCSCSVSRKLWVPKSVLSPWNCLMESDALLSPSQSEPGLVNGGFMMTRKRY